MLPEDTAARYHAGHDPRLAEALVNNREAASIAAIFREVRAAIYSGEYQPGDRLPTRAELAKRKKVSAESIGIVMRMLAAEGLVSSEQGRGTFALARHAFRVSVSAARPQAPVPASVLGALAAAAGAEPAASALETDAAELEDDDSQLAVSMTIDTGGLSQAVSLALAVVEDALRRDGGWDLAATRVLSAGPA